MSNKTRSFMIKQEGDLLAGARSVNWLFLRAQ
jgi:hypothetical protein